MLERLLGSVAARRPWVGVVLRMQQRFAGVKGSYLAAAVTLNLFTSLFPALLVAIAIIGFFTNHSVGAKAEIIRSLGLSGPSAQTVSDALNKAAHSRKFASILGFAGLIWSGLGVVAAIEYALDATWQHTGRGIKDKLRGLGWGAGALLFFGTSIALTAAVEIVAKGVLLVVFSVLAAAVVNVGLWLFTFVVLSRQKLPWRAYLPGSILGGIGLEILKQAASMFGRFLGGSSPLYGTIGAAFAVLAVLSILGRLLVYASVLNVTLWEQKNGTVTVDIEVPKVPGEVPTETDRAGAVEPN